MLPRKGQKVRAYYPEIGLALIGKVLGISYDAGSNNSDGWVEIDSPQLNMSAKLGRETWTFEIM